MISSLYCRFGRESEMPSIPTTSEATREVLDQRRSSGTVRRECNVVPLPESEGTLAFYSIQHRIE